jgi:hypothetical protein
MLEERQTIGRKYEKEKMKLSKEGLYSVYGVNL